MRVDRRGAAAEPAKAYGLADRPWLPNTVDTRFMLASVAKGFTALAIMSLVADANSVTVLWWPVRPKGRRSIIARPPRGAA